MTHATAITAKNIEILALAALACLLASTILVVRNRQSQPQYNVWQLQAKGVTA